MSGRCTNPECGYPDTPCLRRAEFADWERECPELQAALGPATVSPTEPPPEHVPAAAQPAPRPPEPGRFWTGHALGSREVFSLLTDNPPRLVAVAGREDAGKTTLLVSQYLRIAQGGAPGVRFCGSRTLRGWDQLADAAWEWSGEPGLRIVPRTSLGSHREPGLLHLSFKRRWGGDSRAVLPQVSELLLTDFPGEWFERWTANVAYERDMPWLARVEVFWVVVDAPRLLSDRKAGRDARTLVNRVLDRASDGRPVALVLTKIDDVQAPAQAERRDPAAWPGRLGEQLQALLSEFERHTGPKAFFPVAAFPGRAGEAPPEGVLDPLRFALESSRPDAARPTLARHSERYFQCFREEGA